MVRVVLEKMVVSHSFKLPYDLSAAILTFVSLSSSIQIFIACLELGDNGNVGCVSGQSCIGYEGKSLFRILI